MENKKYHSVGKPILNRQFVERSRIDNASTQTITAHFPGLVQAVLWTKICLLTRCAHPCVFHV